MSIDFPNSPSVGATHTVSGRTWEYDGSVWVIKLTDSEIDAKGDLLVGTADNAVARLSVGGDGSMLIAEASQTAGMKWSNPGQDASIVLATGSFL